LKGSGGITTHVDRKGWFTIAVKLSDRCADTFTSATVKAFSSIPEQWKTTLTVDNGKEFSDFKYIEDGTGMKVFLRSVFPLAKWNKRKYERSDTSLFPRGIDWRTVPNKSLSQRVKSSIIGHANAQIIRRPVKSF